MDSLTYREKLIVSLVNEALTNRQISQRLFISEKAVEKSLQSIYEKTGARGRVSLALFHERSKQTIK